MDIKDELTRIFLDQIQVLEESLATAREAQRNAPSAMESASNTTRSEMERMVSALEIDIARLKKQIKQLDSFEIKIGEIEIKGKKIKCCLVPAGMGGNKIGDIQMVSIDSPLGKIMITSSVVK
jgi:predicted metallo-beta-lactamase superfamily hydrolase